MLLAYLVAAALDPVASAAPAIDRANSAWIADLKAGNAAGLAEAYTDDALFILPDGKTITGRKAVQDMYAAGAGSRANILGGEIHSISRTAAGPDLVFESGQGSVRLRGADGVEKTRGGPFLTVWHRERDGQWRIIRNLVF